MSRAKKKIAKKIKKINFCSNFFLLLLILLISHGRSVGWLIWVRFCLFYFLFFSQTNRIKNNKITIQTVTHIESYYDGWDGDGMLSRLIHSTMWYFCVLLLWWCGTGGVTTMTTTTSLRCWKIWLYGDKITVKKENGGGEKNNNKIELNHSCVCVT